MLAVVFWWFYLLLCPVVTLGALFTTAWRSCTLEGAMVRGFSTIAVLALFLGPAWTDAGTMSWWLFNAGEMTRNGHYLVWQYALACVPLYAGMVLLVAWIKRDK